MAKKENTTSIGFEEIIWRAADKLRGNLSASEYEGVVLGLIFLKYISDKFEDKFEELEKDELADEEDRDEYEAEGIFFVPQDARWSVIQDAAHTPEIGVLVDKALQSIEKENPKLRGVLPGNYARPELDKRRLGDVVDLFSNIKMHTSGDEKDLLGRVYEYCLQKFASMEGKNAGEFYTPSCIVRTIVEILKPFSGRVYDPCCGSGGMFVQSAKFLKSHQKELDNISIYGQEFNSSTWKMAHMNVAIRGLEANLGKAPADTFFDDQHPLLKADFIMANPPFNLSDWGADKLQNDKRWKYGIPPSGNANFAWMQHMIHHLSPVGRIGLVLANGALSSQTGGEGIIRQKIVEDDLVEGIVALPAKLFYGPNIEVSLWFLSRNKTIKGKTLFVDARKIGVKVDRQLNVLDDNGILKIATAFSDFRDGKLTEGIPGFCVVADNNEIAQRNFNLVPFPYINSKYQSLEDDSLIKKRWYKLSFSDFIELSSDRVGENIVNEYSITNKGIILRSDKYTNTLSKTISKNKLIQNGDLIFGMSREILNWDIMLDDMGCVSPAYTVYHIKKEIIHPLYVKYYIQSNIEYFSDLIKPASREGQGIDKSLLLNKYILVPPAELYNYIVSEFEKEYKHIKILKNEIILIQNRLSGVLPQLMSGELDINY